MKNLLGSFRLWRYLLGEDARWGKVAWQRSPSECSLSQRREWLANISERIRWLFGGSDFSLKRLRVEWFESGVLDCQYRDRGDYYTNEQAHSVSQSKDNRIFMEFSARGEQPDSAEPQDHERHNHPQQSWIPVELGDIAI